MTDYTAKIKKYDTFNVYGSLKGLAHQISQVMGDMEKITFPNTYRNCDLVAISGMGGSIYNHTVIVSLFEDTLVKPVVQVSGYELPKRVLKDTLFIASSYSGSTEETVMTTRSAIKNDDIVTAITAGGELGAIMKQNKLPYYQFDPKYNPSNQPRCGLGYTIFGPVLLLNKLDYLTLNMKDLKRAVVKLQDMDDKAEHKAAKIVAEMRNKQIILVASEHLHGNVHIFRNQLNETAKTYAEYHLIPELNHHLMEGLTYPKKKELFFIFFPSRFYNSRNRTRMDITKQVIKKQGFAHDDISVDAANKLEEFMLLMQLNSYISFFLGLEYNINPGAIPWVDLFKKQLV